MGGEGGGGGGEGTGGEGGKALIRESGEVGGRVLLC